ncbi:MAG: hypothetical protein ACTSXH_15540 [Promethearchaeota archaeon]
MIIGIKRKKTAIESTYRFFQTIDILISHFKREADKNKIFELTTSETTLEGYLIASAAVHLYHNLGIRVKDILNPEISSVESTRDLELKEKEMLLDELKILLGDSFHLEMEILFKLIEIENKFLSFLIKERDPALSDKEREDLLKAIDLELEEELLQYIRTRPQFCFYDLMSNLMGLTNEIKINILEESASIKELSIEIEKKLKLKEKEDKYIELSTLTRAIQKLQEDFEFHSYKELQLQAIPIRMIKKKIFQYHLEKYPISVNGLKAFIEGNVFKKELISHMQDAFFKTINYDDFESEMLIQLKTMIIEKLKTNPNDLIYFLQALFERDFTDIMFTFNKFGIYNISQLMNMNDTLSKQVHQNMIRYNISKFDIMNLNDRNKDLIYLTKKALCKLDLSTLKKKLNITGNITDLDFKNMLMEDKPEHQELWLLIQKRINHKKNEIKEALRKKELVEKIFFEKLQLKNHDQILLLLEFDHFLENLSKEIFFQLISKILRQLSRIIELYMKITSDKALYLLGLKKISGLTESEDWVRIKLEELMINRITERQKELTVVLNAIDKPFLVNGFMLSRLIDIPLEKSMKELQESPSPLYEDIKPLKLYSEFISPNSYCLAFDLLKRFEKFKVRRKQEVKKIVEKKVEKKEQKKIELRKKQQESAFNWIERRIASALMRINSPGINPTLLYWQENDTKITSDSIKLYSGKKGNILDLFIEFFTFAIDKIQEHAPSLNLPDKQKILAFVETTVKKVLMERIKREPNPDDMNTMLEGERFEISKVIANKIGDFLNKALYGKFKNKRR